MTGIESPVTITTTESATSARCECGWIGLADHHDRAPVTAHARVMDAWAEHWHDTHTEGDNE